MSKYSAVLGFILYLSNGSIPLQHDPFYVYSTFEECNADLVMWQRMAPEWTGVCKNETKSK